MNFDILLRKYAELIVKSGLSVKEGQIVCVSALIEAAPLTRLVAEAAYAAGAREVVVRWSDEAVQRLKYEHAPLSQFEEVPEWFSAYNNGYAAEGACFLTIDAADPDAMSGVDPKKASAWVKASHTACKPFYDGLDLAKNRWCIAAAPSPKWACKVFPGLPEEEAVSRLWAAILKAVRVEETGDPVAAWEEHHKSFQERIRTLNSLQLDRLHYQNSLGTDITIVMPEGHCWAGGGAETTDGVSFFPNMPTEEIFASPDRSRADGTVYSALPLNYHGSLIDRFWLRFAGGKVVDFGAETGYDVLKAILETDEGASHLGEVALVPARSPISEMGILFYNTLFDENAACHFAVGKGFAECLEGGLALSEEEQAARGLNDSAAHVDFMIGTPDLSITGYTKDGKAVPIFTDGNWAI